MKQKNHYSGVLFVIFMLLGSFVVQAQTLKERFDQMIEKSSTYESYKVIKITEINEFYAAVDQELVASQADIKRLQARISDLEVKIDTLNNTLGRANNLLSSSESKNDTIEFLGMAVNKTSYHLLVWTVIIIAAVLAVLAYLMFIKSNSTTSRLKKDYALLLKDFDEHKDKSRENHVKLKRDLQTAINTIEDMKRGGAARRV